MSNKMTLQKDENVVASVTGLLESFDGTQKYYLGDLVLTNQRLCIVSKYPMNVEESLWFEEVEKDVSDSSLIVGDHSIKVRWLYNGNLLHLMQDFQQLQVDE